MAETLAELRPNWRFREKHLSRISQYGDMDKVVLDCADRIAALREKIKKLELLRS